MEITIMCAVLIGAVIGYYGGICQIRREIARNKLDKPKPKREPPDPETERARAIARHEWANLWSYDGSEQREYDE